MKKAIVIALILIVAGGALFLTVGDGISMIKDWIKEEVKGPDGSDDTDKGATRYTITYYDGELRRIEVANGETYSLETIPQKVGHTFLGLFDAAEGGTKYVNESGHSLTPFYETRNLTLYPQFAPKQYELIFDARNGSASGDDRMQYLYGETIGVFPADPIAEGKNFEGWNTKSDGTGTKIVVGRTKLNEEVFDLSKEQIYVYAQYSIKQYEVKLYVFNGVDYNQPPETITVDHGTKIGEIRSKFMSEDRVVVGWSRSWGGAVDRGEITMNTDLYSAEYRYYIQFDARGGSEIEMMLASAGEMVNLPKSERKGYIFDGWTDAEGNVVDINSMPDRSLRLYAAWSPITYTLTFDSCGGSAVAPISGYAETAISLPVPTKKDHAFKGWADKNGTIVNFTKMPYEDMYLTAQWEPIIYTITFDVQGGDPVENISGAAQVPIRLPVPERKGYAFEGWTDAEGNVVDINTMPDRSMRLYAVWSPITYTLTFDSRGGSAVAPISGYAETEVRLPHPEKKGYNFLGWTDINGNIVNFSTMPYQDLSLMAQWEAKIFTINYITEYGKPIPEQKVAYGEIVTLPEPQVDKAYTFLGWYNGDVKQPVSIVMEDEDLVLTAKWELQIQTYTIQTIPKNCNDNNTYNPHDPTNDQVAQNEIDKKMFAIILNGTAQNSQGKYIIGSGLSIGLKLLQDPNKLGITGYPGSSIYGANISNDGYKGAIHNAVVNDKIGKGAVYVMLTYSDGTTQEGYSVNICHNRGKNSYIDLLAVTNMQININKTLSSIRIVTLYEIQAWWKGFLGISFDTVTNWRTENTFYFQCEK